MPEPETLHADRSPAASAQDPMALRTARDAALQAARTAMRDTTRLTRLLAILSEPCELDPLLDRALATLSELFAADVVILLDPGGTGSMAALAAIGVPEERLQGSLAHPADGHLARVLRSGVAAMSERVRDDPDACALLRELGAEVAVWLPVIGSHAARGALVLARCQPRAFTRSDVDLLSAMAYRIALALEQAQRRFQFERILQSNRVIAGHLDDGTAVAREVVATLPAILGADGAALLLPGRDGRLRCVASQGLDPDSDPALSSVLAGVLAAGEPARALHRRVTDPADPTLGPDLELPPSSQVRSLLALRIGREQAANGLLCAFRLAPMAFAADALQIAMLYATQVSVALDNARLYRGLEDELLERARAEQAVRASDARFRAMIQSVSDVIAILDADGVLRYASAATERSWGCRPELLIGRHLLARVHPEDRDEMGTQIAVVQARAGASLTRITRLRCAQDEWRDFEVILINQLEEPAVAGIVATFHDVTERKRFEFELTTLAFQDTLTGLANRAQFGKRLRQAVTQAERQGCLVAVVFFDLDNFKTVNDSLGHACGDRVLQLVAERILACLRRRDLAARLGGDEFTVLIDDLTDPHEILPIADRLVAMLQQPIHLDGRDLFVGGSMGIAVSTRQYESAEELLRRADLAMYRAKTNGKGCYVIFDAELHAETEERLALEADLRLAIEHGELRLFYQPIVSLQDRRVREVEALMRWQHPARGLVPPDVIIPLAEETGLIVVLGRWVLAEACRQVRRWQTDCPGATQLRLSINLSTRQFRHASLIEEVDNALRDTGLEPHHLRLEITEEVLIRDPAVALAKLSALKGTGVCLAIDDFGTGQSGLNLLKHFPVDAIKIDHRSIGGLSHNAQDDAIVRSAIALAQAFGLDTVGEGIETAEQALHLQDLGCRCGQGHLFAPPMSAAALEAMLRSNRHVL